MNPGGKPQCASIEVMLYHLTQPELAERWRVSGRTLERWRRAGTGPFWLQLNGRVLYRLADVLAFEHSSLRRGARPERADGL
jgi:hypothetical protein